MFRREQDGYFVDVMSVDGNFSVSDTSTASFAKITHGMRSFVMIFNFREREKIFNKRQYAVSFCLLLSFFIQKFSKFFRKWALF